MSDLAVAAGRLARAGTWLALEAKWQGDEGLRAAVAEYVTAADDVMQLLGKAES